MVDTPRLTHASTDQLVTIARETVQGTPVATTMALPVEKFTPQDAYAWGDRTGVHAAVAALYGRAQGAAHAAFSAAGPVVVDSFPYLVRSLLGEIATVGAGQHTHTITPLNALPGHPPSLTVADYQGTPAGSGVRVWPGACLEELTIHAGASVETVTWSGKGYAYPSAIADSSVQPAPSGVMPWAGWRLVATIDGTVVPVDALRLRLFRPSEVVHTSAGTQRPHIIVRGELQVTGEIRVPAAVDESMLTPLLGNTQPAVTLAMGNGQAGADELSLTVTMSRTAWTTTTLARDLDAVGYHVQFAAIGNATDVGASGGYSPLSVTVVNQVGAGVY